MTYWLSQFRLEAHPGWSTQPPAGHSEDVLPPPTDEDMTAFESSYRARMHDRVRAEAERLAWEQERST